MKNIARYLLFVACLLTSPHAFPQAISKATWVTPSWEGYIDENGKGLYYDVVKAAYAQSGVEIAISYRPWKRALFEVAKGKADFTGADSPGNKYLHPKTPILRSTETIFFKKSTIPSYRNIDTLEGKIGVWASGYTENLPEPIKRHLHGTENPSRNAAFQMVLLGRADYFFDNDFQLAQTMRKFEGKFAADEYTTATIHVEKLYLCFTKSPRGQQLADLFDQGMKKLSHSGELKRIYAKWDRHTPHDFPL